MTETIFSKRPNPCKDCSDRYPGCSDHCKKPEHKAWEAEQQLIRENKKSYRSPIWKHGDRDCRRK